MLKTMFTPTNIKLSVVMILLTIQITQALWVSELQAQEIIKLPRIQQNADIVLDAEAGQTLWAHAHRLSPLIKNNNNHQHIDSKSQCDILIVDGWLLCGITVKESAAIVARESLLMKDLWFDDNVSIDVNDGVKTYSIHMNALGGLCVYRNNSKDRQALDQGQIISFAKVHRDFWRVEVALRLDLFDMNAASNNTKSKALRDLRVEIKRERQQRGLEAFQTYENNWQLLIPGSSTLEFPARIRIGECSLAANRMLVQVTKLTKATSNIIEKGRPTYSLQPSYGHKSVDEKNQRTRLQIALAKTNFHVVVENSDIDMAGLSQSDTEIWSGDYNEIYIGIEGVGYLEPVPNKGTLFK